MDLRLAHDLQAVGNGFDAGVGTAASGEGGGEDHEQSPYAEGGNTLVKSGGDVAGDGAEVGEVGRDAADDKDGVGD